jgi:hydroxyethylthiazole kinase-like uncharacterized protein yjeF
MRHAGRAVARLAQAVAPHARRIEVIAGPGNNGGDGFEAALHGHSRAAVRVWWLGTVERQPADAQASRQAAQAAGVEICRLDAATLPALAAALGRSDEPPLLIDALLGRGLSRPADGLFAAVIDTVNRHARQVLAVDLPSGLNGDTGHWPPGAAVVRADWTLALLGLAPGLFTGDGRDAAGEVWWHDLGASAPADSAVAWLEQGAAQAALIAPRRHAQHKGSFGDVWVVGGDVSMAGAAWLAGRAALQCGAGRVYLDLLDPSAQATDPLQPELMLGARADAARLAAATVVAGCGGGAAIVARLPELIAHAGRLVLDADALNAVSADAALIAAVAQRATRGLATVLTPHPLEAARLLGVTLAEVQRDRLLAARQLVERYQVVVVLKGSGTVVAAPGGLPSINTSGSAALATPGSGDVLAGALGALWSRAHGGLSAPHDSAVDTARRAALTACHLHGQVAQSMSPRAEALPAGELAAGLGRALRGLAPLASGDD